MTALAEPATRRWSSPFAGFRPKHLRRDFVAGLNVMVLAFPLSMAFAIAAGVKPEQGLLTAIIGGILVAIFSGSPVQIGGPTGAFVIITYRVISEHGAAGLVTCTVMAGAMLCLMGLVGLGAVIRYIPFPVSRAFTTGIGLLIFGTQIKDFLGLQTPTLPPDFVAKMSLLWQHLGTTHLPTVGLAGATLLLIVLWPKRLARILPGAMAGLVFGTVASGVMGLHENFAVATVGSQYGEIHRALPTLAWPTFDNLPLADLLRPSFTIALLIAMQALLCAVVTDGMIDHRHNSNQELVAQGIANLIAPLFGCIPTTGAVARSVINADSGGRSAVAGIVHSLLLFALMMAAAPLLGHVPLACLSAVLVFAAWNMAGWQYFRRLHRWPASDSLVFGVTLVLTVLTNLTIAVEVGVVLAALLLMKRISETTQITAVDGSSDTEGSHHSLVGKEIPEGVMVYRIFGAFFFGAVDKLASELKRAQHQPKVLILRTRKVLAIDATGLQALEDLLVRLRKQGQHLILSAPHTQPMMVMRRAGFVDRLGLENVCPHVTAALARARELLGLPPMPAEAPDENQLQARQQDLDAARRELADALSRASRLLDKPSGS